MPITLFVRLWPNWLSVGLSFQLNNRKQYYGSCVEVS
jgi:hypothetical protein